MRKTVSLEDISLSYLVKNEGANQIVFFIHGNSCSARMWQKQLDSKLFSKYKLIAIDLPGHGFSSPSNNPNEDYSPISTSRILSKAVKRIAGNDPFCLVGFSYGSNLAAEMTMHNVKPNGIVLLASSVTGAGYGLDKIFVRRTTPSILFYNEIQRNIVSDFFNKAILVKDDTKNIIDDYLKTDANFKPALFKTVTEGKISDEIKILYDLKLPVCVIFGSQDQLINIDYLDSSPFRQWRNQIYKLPNAGHWTNIDNQEIFELLLLDYISEAFKAAHV